MTNTFAQYTRTTKAWLRNVDEDVRKVFGRVGYDAALVKDINIAHIGGVARAATATRDGRGRFMSTRNGQHQVHSSSRQG